jgi:hypothetical protein
MVKCSFYMNRLNEFWRLSQIKVSILELQGEGHALCHWMGDWGVMATLRFCGGH